MLEPLTLIPLPDGERAMSGAAGTPSGDAFIAVPMSRGDSLSIVRELQRHRDVLGVAKGLDHQLQRVLVLADDAELVPLDADLELARDVLDPLPKVARQLVVDAGI